MFLFSTNIYKKHTKNKFSIFNYCASGWLMFVLEELRWMYRTHIQFSKKKCWKT